MPPPLKISLLTAFWYGALSALLIFVVAPWLHAGAGYAFRDGVTLPIYQRNALVSAVIGYVLLCGVLIWGDASRRNSAANAPGR
ncbi:MAG: hypothetical protein H7Y38_00375 [Armatimonadetes bacterium]|nr:hypothetical protein [Armatimonadota bacterium]